MMNKSRNQKRCYLFGHIFRNIKMEDERGEGSKVFAGFRPLGYVSNHIPCVTRYITSRKEHLIITVTGKSFHTYGSNRLGILSVSKQHPEDITALAADAYLVFTAAGTDIYAWRRGCELQRIMKGHDNPVHLLFPFGPKLISVDLKSLLKVWDIKTGVEELELTFNSEKFKISAICHPSTYLDKILIGSEQGSLQLWNLKSTKLVYTFKGWGSGVECIEQAPALDVVAVGLRSGDILLHNLKYDEVVVKFHQDWGAVTALAFRTDGPPCLLSGSNVGNIAVWSLEERKLVSQMRGVHSQPVQGLECLHGEPLMITSSGDNTLKMWIFDMPDSGARLLRYREGHAAPPSKVRFYGALGKNILSAGQDSSMRVFSTQTDTLNKSLGHASFNRKLSKKHRVVEDPARMPPVIDFTTETTRETEWDNIGCIHRGLEVTTTWSWNKQKMGELKLVHDRFKSDKSLKHAKATCLCLSACGNFAIIGYSSGHVDRFNIQSGLHRGEFNHGSHPAHKNPLRGVASDQLNQQVISGDSAGILKFWRFKSKEMIGKLVLEGELSQIRLHRDSSLLACALETFTVVLVDIDTRTVVRKFQGHKAGLTDMAFSHDGRWLVTSSLDTTTRVWDLPSGHCIDFFSFPSPATSIDFSPAGDMLASSHVDDLGIYLWMNKSLYQHLSLAPVPSGAEPLQLCLPQHLAVPRGEKGVEEEMKMEIDTEGENVFASPEQLREDLITLANLPTSRWLNLLNLDVIKAKNKPRAAPKKPKAAPFFLPTVPGLEQQFLIEEKKDGSENTRFLTNITSFTPFGKALGQAKTPEDFGEMYKEFLEKGPSALDIEIRSLSPEGGGSVPLMSQFLEMLELELKKNTNFEAVQAHLGLFIKVHGETIVSDPELRKYLVSIQQSLENSWNSLQTEMDTCLCLLNFSKSSFL
ncbi:WD repeat-containing protein 36 [Eurytemora carolleeae]|uniref:WD repeat-containing protein 36 n=1 Tax=Eurytemora carolleeae TaxID=1294199 RepID=UPI000C78CFDA|nr:WD repeat-containing protein 36 [Eurytemora carolleeae]|eukprot:XP_023323395.1 WD repeat-containing protein 36-like [Eurytemora affinis]